MDQTKWGHLPSGALEVIRGANRVGATLLITGSTGTGKSFLAKAAHEADPKRSGGKWMSVNLATLSENLIESELFGHERGAFTGADSRRVGKLEAANGGTVFLDEIGELPLRLQAKLLDFLQYKRVSPVGSNREVELDVRIIAATNRNLDACVRAGEFRADLFHRLCVFQVRLPDVSLQPKNLTGLARKILFEKGERYHGTGRTKFSIDAEVLIRSYSWPGNIRELENAIEYAVAMTSSDEIHAGDFPEAIRMHASSLGASQASLSEQVRSPSMGDSLQFLEVPMKLDFHETKENFERGFLESALRLCQGQINLTSRRTGLNKVSLTGKIRRYGIDWRKIRAETLGPALRGKLSRCPEDEVSL